MAAAELCPTCLHLQTCSRHLEYQQPIIYCERYESIPNASCQKSPTVELNGLCRTCEKRYICTVYKPAGGVWHCDDYI